jgi:hypothetical protein
MDPDIQATEALKAKIQDNERWLLRNPNPCRLFTSMSYEGMTH